MRRFRILLLAILCLSFPGSAFTQNVEYVGSTFWSDIHDVEVVGDYAYCVFYNGLVVLDLTDPDSLSIVSQLYCHGIPGTIVISGDYAYLTDRGIYYNQEDLGFHVVDISAPENPILVGSCITPWEIYKTFVVNEYIYLSAGMHGMLIIDASNPENPAIVGTCDTPGFALGIFASGNYACVADSDSGLQIINVSNPEEPVLVGNCSTPGIAYDVFVSSDYAYMADYTGLQIIDISNPEDPILEGNCDAPGYASDVFIVGNYAYLGWWTRNYGPTGFEIIDISDPANPATLGSCTAGHSNISVEGNYAYVINWGGTGNPDLCFCALQIVDVSDPVNPALTGGFYPGHYVDNVFAMGDYAYVADGFLWISDVSDPENPTLAGSCETPGTPWDVFVSGDYAYVADNDSGLQIVNISNPAVPILVAGYDAIRVLEVFVAGHYAYLIGIWGSLHGLHIIDILDLENLIYTGNYRTDNWRNPEGIFVEGNYAYMADGSSGLLIIDVSNPSNPTLAGSYDTPDLAREVFVSGDYAYVADGDLQIIDVSDPPEPASAGSYDTPGQAYDVFVSGNYAYVADRDSGLQIVNVSEASSPTFAGSLDTPYMAMRVFVAGDYIYVADVHSLMILRFDPQTGIEEVGTLPDQFALGQNYPNPFNASTQITFSLPEPQEVTLTVYNLLGREVRTLLDEHMQAGIHHITFDASDLASGIYFYRIQAGESVESKRMVLLK